MKSVLVSTMDIAARISVIFSGCRWEFDHPFIAVALECNVYVSSLSTRLNDIEQQAREVHMKHKSSVTIRLAHRDFGDRTSRCTDARPAP
jgi:hypothetical protein